MTLALATQRLFVAALLLLLGGCATTLQPPQRGEAQFQPTAPRMAEPSQLNEGAIYQTGFDLRLFEDIKARRVGDILTIVLAESTQASKSANTETGKDTEIEIPAPTIFGRGVTSGGQEIIATEIESATDFSGEADSDQSNQLTGSITVTVAEVLPNGNLVVRGEKWIGINQGDEYIRLEGIVRQVDVQPDNSVLSTQIADARISYGGTGALADANAQGWATRFFNSPIWPF
jgi:flagellar L-ring protein precursor FlgH